MQQYKDRDFLDVLFRSMKSGAFWIEFFVVFTGVIQWSIASMSADGYSIPGNVTWIHIASGIFGSTMAVVEGFAVAYVFAALSKKWNWILGILTIFMSVALVFVIAPSTYARTLGANIGDVLPDSVLWIWSTAFITSRMLTVASVAWASQIQNSNEVQADFDNKVQKVTMPLTGKIIELTTQLQNEIESKASIQEWSNQLQEQVSSLNEEIDNLTQQLEMAKTTLSIEYDDSNIAPTIDRLIELYTWSPDLSQQVASVIIGCSRQNVGQLLKKLEDDGRIKRNNGTVIVLEKEKEND